MLKQAAHGGVFLLNSVYDAEQVWPHLPIETQRAIREKRLRFYVIDADRVARETGMGGRVNTIMQTCFFAISGVLPREQAIDAIKRSIKKTYGKRGEAVVQRNFAAVDADAGASLSLVTIPGADRCEPEPPQACARTKASTASDAATAPARSR